jgi:L-ribulose-5-phosphate 4-epimerase
MAYEQLKEQVFRANLALVEAGLVVLTWGNASGADRAAGVMAIKPSGVSYDKLGPADIVVLSIATGEVVDGKARPSSDTPTHLHLYREFEAVNGVVHTHSTYATSFAQALRPIPCFGTTHADNFYGEVLVTRPMRAAEIETDYELNTGRVIVEQFRQGKIDPASVPGVLVASQGGRERDRARVHRPDGAGRAVDQPGHEGHPAGAARQALPPQARPPRLLRAADQVSHGTFAACCSASRAARVRSPSV